MVFIIHQLFLIEQMDIALVLTYGFVALISFYLNASYERPDILFTLEDKSMVMFIILKVIGYTAISSLVLFYIKSI